MSKDTTTPAPTLTTVPDPIPQDLKDKFQSVQALATTYNFLHNMRILRDEYKAHSMCLEFIHNLYENVLADAHAHPDADRIAELKNLRRVVAVVNGEAATIIDAEKMAEAREKREKKAKKVAVVKKGKSNVKRKA